MRNPRQPAPYDHADRFGDAYYFPPQILSAVLLNGGESAIQLAELFFEPLPGEPGRAQAIAAMRAAAADLGGLGGYAADLAEQARETAEWLEEEGAVSPASAA